MKVFKLSIWMILENWEASQKKNGDCLLVRRQGRLFYIVDSATSMYSEVSWLLTFRHLSGVAIAIAFTGY